ncbi:MAG TPA: carbonic anhydrase [Vicinamibacterales bacterium]|nr:carbonic anhydrase [Vicinamibacterales bacterium]
MIGALKALGRLRDGNRRFATDQATPRGLDSAARRELALGQEPFATILGCSDSRVPAELVFDQGFGDLFVIRVAGNIVAPSQVGSIEFAAAYFGTKLVVVMGHEQCGAITAAVADLEGAAGATSPNLRSIVDRVRPSVETVRAARPDMDRATMMREAIRANVRASTNHLRHGSAILERMIHEDGLMVVGAEYSLETGVVDFFDGV